MEITSISQENSAVAISLWKNTQVLLLDLPHSTNITLLCLTCILCHSMVLFFNPSTSWHHVIWTPMSAVPKRPLNLITHSFTDIMLDCLLWFTHAHHISTWDLTETSLFLSIIWYPTHIRIQLHTWERFDLETFSASLSLREGIHVMLAWTNCWTKVAVLWFETSWRSHVPQYKKLTTENDQIRWNICGLRGDLRYVYRQCLRKINDETQNYLSQRTRLLDLTSIFAFFAVFAFFKIVQWSIAFINTFQQTLYQHLSLYYPPPPPPDKMAAFLRVIFSKTGSDNGSAPDRRQAIIWTNADPIHWRI